MVVEVVTAYPTGTKHHLGHRNPGTGEVAATEQEEGNPTVMV
jgi:hypothetical protein